MKVGSLLFGARAGRFRRVTWKIVRHVLARRLFHLAVLGGGSFVLGLVAIAVATLFSDLVNGFEINSVTTHASILVTARTPFEDVVDAFTQDLPTYEGRKFPPLVGLLHALPFGNTPAGVLSIVTLLAVVVAGIGYLNRTVRARLDADIYTALRTDAFIRCFDHHDAVIAGLPKVDEGEQKQAVTISSSINRGAEAISNTYTYLITSAQQLITLATAAATAGQNLPIALGCLLVILAQIALSRAQAKRLRRRRQRYDRVLNRLQSRTADGLDARELLLAFDRGHIYQRRLDRRVRVAASRQYRNVAMEAGYSAAYEVVDRWGQVAVICLAALVAILISQPGGAGGEIRPLVFALTLYSSLLTPAQALIRAYDAMAQTEAAANSFLAILETPTGSTAGSLTRGWTALQPIVFEGVSFTFPGAETPVLNGLNTTIPAGQVTLILGRSGSGKTTIGRLALGFLSAAPGSIIRIGGQRIEEWDRTYLHRAMSYAPQNDHVLDASVRENLRLAQPVDSRFIEADFQGALKRVGLASASLSRKARALSGGEMQRLSAARILLDPAEILILDEPMAGIDVFTMSEIAPELARHWTATGQTVVLISHKLVFAGMAAKIIILGSHGEIVEEGHPAELLAAGGEYARIHAEAMHQAGP